MTIQVTYSLRQIDGGPNYFAQFSNSLPTDPNFFPISAWLEGVQSQQDINLDKAAGLNVYTGITANSNFSLIQSNGMYVIAQQDELRTNQTVINSPIDVGWLLHDEIDMQLGPGQGYTTLNNIIASLPNDGHFTYNNYGKGVMFWETDAEAARFVNAQDVTSADVYWFTDVHVSSGSEGGELLNNGQPLTKAQTQLAANYGYTIDRIRALDATDGELHPIWGFVEVGWPWTETAAQGARQILPAEIQAAVWHEIIAGARGIIYFNHSFGGPEQTQNVLRDPAYAAQLAAVTQTDALIKQLAPVLNSPFDDGFVTVNSSVRAMAKYYGGEHYVFAGSTINGASTSTDTFTLAGITSGTAVVIGENRTITITNGQFADDFADGNAIHIYHIITDAAPLPSAPTIASFSTDSNVVGDGITNDNTLALTGTAVANSTVTVFDGATQIGTATANSGGAWSHTTGTLSNATHSFTATATSEGTTSSRSSPLTVTVDTVAPSAPTIDSFSTDTGTVGDRITSDNTLTLTGTAAANSTVRVFDGATQIGTPTANGSGAWAYTTTTLPNGVHGFTATATDAAGNTSTASAAFAVTVTTLVLSTPAIASFSSDSGTTGDRITNDNTLTLTGTAVADSTVKVFDGASQIGTATVDAAGAWTFTTATLTNGSHSFTATITDTAGNSSAASAALAVTVDTAANAPIIASFSSDSGALGDRITNDNTLTLTGTAEANSAVKVFDAGTQIGTPTANGSGAWSFATASLTEGPHNFTATITDVAGNTSGVSAALAVTIDTVAPNAPAIAAFSPSTNVLTGTADANATVKVFDGVTQLGTATANGSGAWSFTTSALGGGSHAFTAAATDAAGNASAASAALNVTIVGPSAPTIAAFSPDTGVLGDGISNANMLTLTGTALANSTVKIFDGATLVGSATSNASGTWSVATTKLADGAHSLTANVVDSAGVTSTASTAFNVTVKNTVSVFDTQQQNWTSVTTYHDSQGRPTSQTTNYDSGIRVDTVWDAASQYDWTYSVRAYDSAGRVTSEDTQYDNGRLAVQKWDPGNNYDWSYSANFYDSQLNKTEENLDWDNGNHSRWNFDTQNKYSWSSAYTAYDSGWKKTYEEQKSDKGISISWSAPVVVDLDGDGVEITQLSSSSASFDMNGDGQRSHTAWIGPDDGFLVIDLGAGGKQGPDGIIDHASEIVFTQWLQGSTSDMEALRGVFDTNHNGQLDAGDARWSEFRVWKDVNGDGVTQAGEVIGLNTLDIVSIDLNPNGPAQTFVDGSAVQGTSSYTRADGSTGMAGDVILAHDASNVSAELPRSSVGSEDAFHWPAQMGTVAPSTNAASVANAATGSHIFADQAIDSAHNGGAAAGEALDHVGADIFMFATNFGKGAAAAVQASGLCREIVQFGDNSLETFAAVLAHAGNSVIASGDAHDALTSKNVKLLDLHQSDFKFA